nr:MULTISPECIES: ABC transporter ATP-binding protein [unclassified Microbacterium]
MTASLPQPPESSSSDTEAAAASAESSESAQPAAKPRAPRAPRATAPRAPRRTPARPKATVEAADAATDASADPSEAVDTPKPAPKPRTPRTTASRAESTGAAPRTPAKKPAAPRTSAASASTSSTPRTTAARKPAAKRPTAKKPATPRASAATETSVDAATTPDAAALSPDLVIPPRPPLPVRTTDSGASADAISPDAVPADPATTDAVAENAVPADAVLADPATADAVPADPTPADVAVEEPVVSEAAPGGPGADAASATDEDETAIDAPADQGSPISAAHPDIVVDTLLADSETGPADALTPSVADDASGESESAEPEATEQEATTEPAPTELEATEPEPAEPFSDPTPPDVRVADENDVVLSDEIDLASEADATREASLASEAGSAGETESSPENDAQTVRDEPELAADPEPEPAPLTTPHSGSAPADTADADQHTADAVPALTLRGVTKTFGELRAVDAIDLTVPAGSFYGLVGPNGAGKTTTLSIIAGLLRADGGTVQINGVDAARRSREAKKLIGVLPDRLRTFDRLTGRQLLSYYGALRSLPAPLVESRIADLARAFDLVDALARPVSDYSAGMTKKVMLAGAMIHSPRLLVLDEPFEAVDPVSSAVILDILGTYVDHGGTVILSSHGMELVERVCSRVAVIVSGQVLAEGTVDEVRGEATLEQRFLELAGGLGDVEGLEWLHTFSA